MDEDIKKYLTEHAETNPAPEGTVDRFERLLQLDPSFKNIKTISESLTNWSNEEMNGDISFWQDTIRRITESKTIRNPNKKLASLKRFITIAKKSMTIRAQRNEKTKSVELPHDENDTVDDNEITLQQIRNHLIKFSTSVRPQAKNMKSGISPTVPMNWWRWTRTRIVNIKITGEPTYRSFHPLMDVLLKSELTFTYKIRTRQKNTIITVDTEEQQNIVAEILSQQENLTVTKPEWRKPAVKLIYLRPQESETIFEFVNRIMKLNGFRDPSRYTILKDFKMHNSMGIILQVDALVRSEMETKLLGKLATGSGFSRIVDDFNIMCCRNCHQFGHTSKTCESQRQCERCARTHLGKCSETSLCCPSCRQNGHAAYSRHCKLFENEIHMKMAEIDYHYEYVML